MDKDEPHPGITGRFNPLIQTLNTECQAVGTIFTVWDETHSQPVSVQTLHH